MSALVTGKLNQISHHQVSELGAGKQNLIAVFLSPILAMIGELAWI